MRSLLKGFLVESNRIEGITGTNENEIDAADNFMSLPALTVPSLNELQQMFAPNKPLRERAGLNVRVGRYIAPEGGPHIREALDHLLRLASESSDPWAVHVEYETLHPYLDGNGRTGRMVWAWQMQRLGRRPFALGFLHTFYYQTLEHRHG